MCFKHLTYVFSQSGKMYFGEHSEKHLKNTRVLKRCFFNASSKYESFFMYLLFAKLLSCYFTLHSILISSLTASYPIRLIGCIAAWAIIGSCFYRHCLCSYSLKIVLLLCDKDTLK